MGRAAVIAVVLACLACGSGPAGEVDATSDVSADLFVDVDVDEAAAPVDSLPDPRPDPVPDSATDPSPDGFVDAPDPSPDLPSDGPPEAEFPPATCGFQYGFAPPAPPPAFPDPSAPRVEPTPASTWALPVGPGRADLVMPSYADTMPLFSRAADWGDGTRCYELPSGVAQLTQAQAFAMYKRLAEATTGGHVDPSPGHRTVVGVRGAYPGTFSWNGNAPNRFNDTLVLLWVDAAGGPRVLEFAGHTDTGAWVFDAASSLWPNRHYPYRCGWHHDFNALAIDLDGYAVRDDANSNGHWDSDRNGWLAPLGTNDFDRAGGAHNIHVASVDGPLETAQVDNWSAGCQNIPGMANWTQFITNAWTALGDPVDYFLLDARDIPGDAWADCTPDGSHACPYRIGAFPFQAQGDTTGWPVSQFDVYNCSTADESGPEVVYVFTTQAGGTVTATVDDDPNDAGPDVDVHLLMADDPNACLARGNVSLTQAVPPGRYLVVVDSWVDKGTPLAGKFQMSVDLQ